MRKAIADNLRRLSFLIKVAHLTPNQVLKALGVFKTLLEDKSNFVSDDLIGKKNKNKETITELAFSPSGLSKAKQLFSGELKSIYDSGTAGFDVHRTYDDNSLSLSYFLIQFMGSIATIASVHEEMPSLLFNSSKIWNSVKDKKYQEAKKALMGFIGEIEEKLKKTPEKLMDVRLSN